LDYNPKLLKKTGVQFAFTKILLPLQPQTLHLSVAQLVEQMTLNHRATGSSPVGETKEKTTYDKSLSGFFFFNIRTKFPLFSIDPTLELIKKNAERVT
jgi:hypothetical protein